MPITSASFAQWGMVLLQLLIATACGGLIGYQRETAERPAGFRTHILVCVGSAIYMQVSVLVAGHNYDPARIAAQVASGIGFLGAGTIIKQGSFVRGLTTAASLWAVAGIGLAAGFGGPTMIVALLGTIVVFIGLTFMRRIELTMERGVACVIHVTMTDARQRLEWVRGILTAHGFTINTFSVDDLPEGDTVLTIESHAPNREEMESAISDIARDPNVSHTHWECR